MFSCRPTGKYSWPVLNTNCGGRHAHGRRRSRPQTRNRRRNDTRYGTPLYTVRRPRCFTGSDRSPSMSSPATLRNRLRWLGHRISATPLFTETLPSIGAKMRAYAQLMRLNRPIGIWLLLWPVMWALWLSSNGRPDPHVFVVFVLGVVLTRSAGCAINDFADRNFDGHVQRTRDRPLVT